MISNPIFCYSPSLYRETGVLDLELTITSSELQKPIVIYRHAINEVVEFDISPILQPLFDRKKIQPSVYNSSVCKNIYLKGKSNMPGGGVSNWNLNTPIQVVYGAIQIGEKYTQVREYTVFDGLPFTVSILVSKLTTIFIQYDKYTPVVMYNLLSGKHDVLLEKTRGAKVIIIKDAYTKSSPFVKVFDKTFRSKNKNIFIKLNISEYCGKGYYLRWVNRYSDFEYYLFEDKGEVSNVSENTNLMENVLTTEYNESGVHYGTNHPLSKNTQKTINLFAHLVDQNTFNNLQGLVNSPIVELYKGDNKWIRVNIAPGAFAKTKEVLQDFNCTLILPQIYTQAL